MRRTGGFTYVGLLLAVALAGVALAAAGTVWRTAVQRDREAQLEFVGTQFQLAIRSYYETSPGAKELPRSVQDLLEDKRFPEARRHLRRLYVDPMTGHADWEWMRQGDRIVGVHSRSVERAFRVRESARGGGQTYADWQYIYVPGDGAPAGARPATPPRAPAAAANPFGTGAAESPLQPRSAQ